MNDLLSDEEYLDSLLEKVTKSSDKSEELSSKAEKTKEETIEEANSQEAQLAYTDITKIVPQDINFDNATEEELNAVADSAIAKLLSDDAAEEETVKEQKPMEDFSLDQLLEQERSIKEEPAVREEFDNPVQEEKQSEDMISEKPVQAPKTEDSNDLLESLDSIVKEIKEESDTKSESEGVTGEESLQEPEKKAGKKKREKKIKKPEIDINADIKPAGKENGFLAKMKNLFFKVEIVEENEEELSENERVLKELEKEEKKKAKAEAKEKAKVQKEANKKQNDAKKQELAKLKKNEKEKKQQERKLKKEKLREERGPEERVKVKPVFIIFMGTVITALVLIIVTMSNYHYYSNNIHTAMRYFENGRYETAFQELSGMKLKGGDQALYEKARMVMRLERQYSSYVNFMNLDMPKEALNSLIKGLAIYDEKIQEAKTLDLEEEMNEIKENILYGLEMDFMLSEEEARAIANLDDTNEYTKEIELYSRANQ